MFDSIVSKIGSHAMLAVSIIVTVIILLILSWFLCIAGFVFGKSSLCVPFEILVNFSEKAGDKYFFYKTHQKIKNHTADDVDVFLYGKMLGNDYRDKTRKAKAQKITPNIPQDELVTFYYKKSIEMGNREARVAYANLLNRKGELLRFNSLERHKAQILYAQALVQAKAVITTGCQINSDVTMAYEFYTYKKRIGKVDGRALDKMYFVRDIATDDEPQYARSLDNIKQATLIYLYDLINCNNVMQNHGGVNDYIPKDFTTFKAQRNENARVLLYTLEVLTKQNLDLPHPEISEDIQIENELKQRAILLAKEYENDFLSKS